MHTISLEGLEFFAYHGVFPEENKIGNKYRIDITLTLDLSHAAASDALENTVDYGKLYKLIEENMKRSSKLLEHIGGRIVRETFATFEEVDRVAVSVYKFNPPIGGTSTWAKVCLDEARPTEGKLVF